MKKPLFLPFWVIGLGILILYGAGLFVTLAIFDVPRQWAARPIDQILPALQNAAAFGEASALVGSLLTVISILFLLYTIRLQQRIRDEQAVETHWFELLKRWTEFAEDKELIDRLPDYQGALARVEIAFRIDDSDRLSQEEGLYEITMAIVHKGGLFKAPTISDSLDRLYAGEIFPFVRKGSSNSWRWVRSTLFACANLQFLITIPPEQ